MSFKIKLRTQLYRGWVWFGTHLLGFNFVTEYTKISNNLLEGVTFSVGVEYRDELMRRWQFYDEQIGAAHEKTQDSQSGL